MATTAGAARRQRDRPKLIEAMSPETRGIVDCLRSLARRDVPPVPGDSLDWNLLLASAEAEGLGPALGLPAGRIRPSRCHSPCGSGYAGTSPRARRVTLPRLTRSDWHPELGDVIGAAAGDRRVVHYEHRFREGELEKEARAAGLTVVFHERRDEGTAVLLV